jgi:hypothetical protein
MSDKLCLDSIRDPHESHTSLVIPSLPEIYPYLSILHHHTPRRISSGSQHFSFPEEIDTLEYSWVKATTVSVRLQIYLWSLSIPIGFLVPLQISWRCKKFQQAFWRCCRGYKPGGDASEHQHPVLRNCPLILVMQIKANTTHGFLLAPKTCTNFVIKCYRSRDVDGQKFVIGTVNKLPHARLLLVLEQSLVLKGGSDIASCYSPTSISAQFHALWLFWKYLYQRNFTLLTCGACNFSPCLWRLKSRTVLTLFYSLFSFSGFYLGVFENFLQRETKFLGWFPRSLKWYLLPHQRL